MPKQRKTTAKNSQDFVCNICGKQLSSAYNLRIHNDTNCSTSKNFICEICESSFLTQNSLKTHMNSLHLGDKKFACRFCEKTFTSKGQVKVHERSHTKEKAFVCGICGKGFSHRESLVTHSTIHTGIKPYACECCLQTFSCVGNLIKHRKVRPDTCGLPIYTNQKIRNRAGVKTKGSEKGISLIVTDAKAEFIIEDLKEEEEENQMIVEEVEDDRANHIMDHQYVTTEPEELERKEMDVFDYIGFEIRNIEEQEKSEMEKNEEIQEELLSEELIVESEEFLVEEEIAEEENLEETIVIERVDEIQDEITSEEEHISESEPVDDDGALTIIQKDEGFEDFLNYVKIVDDCFHCLICPKVYQKAHITVKHLKVDHAILLRNYNYDSANRYRKVQRDRDWKCQFCPKRYTSKKLRDGHESVHGQNGDLLYKCSVCPAYFATFGEVEFHQSESHEDRLRCSFDGCGKQFDSPEKVLNHFKYAHKDRKSLARKYVFVCELCGRNFSSKVALSDHERSNCGKKPIYECVVCNKNYHSAGSLKTHMTIHNGNLDFECSFCPKRFRTKGQLTVHTRSHTKEKSFTCAHCPASFSHRESLLTHNTLHTGIKRFECSSCEKQFSCISNLQAHRKSHKNTCGDSQIKKVSDADNSVRSVKPDIAGY